MKRGIILLVLLVLLTSPVILATEDDIITPTDNTTIPSSEDAIKQVKEELSALRGGLDENTENILEREINIPDLLQTPVRIIFGLKDGYTITIERLIVLCAIWIMLFIVIRGALKLTPFLNKGYQNIIGSIIIVILIALTGIIDMLIEIFFGARDTFKWLEALGPFKFIIALVLAILIIGMAHYVMHKLEKKIFLMKAEDTGENIRAISEMGKTISKSNEL
ncbi:hypothetical protein KAI32_03890 [Candidatus Pacearchaeota archaeon]|nr:hypothetical protein [Candidatus Pacearchaeota archaeon]